MSRETRAPRAFWAICALLTALLLASPGASQAPDDSDKAKASPVDAAVERQDDDAKASGADEDGDDSADRVTDAGGVDSEMPEEAVQDPDIEEIVVEGTQTESLAEAPIAVTQFSAMDI